MTFATRGDTVDGGALHIIETVTELNGPIRRRVRLCDQQSGRCIREAWSDPVTGEVTFSNLRAGPWVLYSLDHEEDYQAVAISHRYATLDGDRP
jgi:hypothetical protein